MAGRSSLAGQLSSFGRLVGAAWVLIRADALLPAPLDPYLPPSGRAAARFLRLFKGKHARAGRAGERLALALEDLGPAAIKDPSGRPTGRSWAANLMGADLRGALLVGTCLVQANLSDANLDSAEMDGADLAGAKLQRAMLPGRPPRRG